MSKKILFLHGLESKPGGRKAEYIKSLGYELSNPHLPKESWEESVKIAQEEIDSFEPDIIVGSSRGGALAMNLETSARLVLIAPAWKKYGTATSSNNAFVLHSEFDVVVPYMTSFELFQNSEHLIVLKCGENHRMSDESSFKMLKLVLDNI